MDNTKKPHGIIKFFKVTLYVIIASCALGFLLGFFSMHGVKPYVNTPEKVGETLLGISIPTIFGVGMGTAKPILSSENPIINFISTVFKLVITPVLLAAYMGAALCLSLDQYVESNLGGIGVYGGLMAAILTCIVGLIVIVPIIKYNASRNKIAKMYIKQYSGTLTKDDKKYIKHIVKGQYKAGKKANEPEPCKKIDLIFNIEKGVVK